MSPFSVIALDWKMYDYFFFSEPDLILRCFLCVLLYRLVLSTLFALKNI